MPHIFTMIEVSTIFHHS